MQKTITEPRLSQYGTDGWKPHYEWFVECSKCKTTFLSNAYGAVRCNGKYFADCPYCTKNEA